MALKILLADDSMTAQNMGKKILVEAGYEVIAVSNGAAAVKKIAEHKPDLVVADPPRAGLGRVGADAPLAPGTVLDGDAVTEQMLCTGTDNRSAGRG